MTKLLEISCTFCPQTFKSLEELHLHQVGEHNLYKDSDTEITSDTINQLRTTMGKVKWLLEKYPSCRGDDRILYLMFCRIFQKNLVYDDATGRIQFRNKEGVTYDEWRSIVSWDTLGRARRKIQETFPDLKPSEVTQAKREARRQAIQGSIKKMTYSSNAYQEANDEFQNGLWE